MAAKTKKKAPDQTNNSSLTKQISSYFYRLTRNRALFLSKTKLLTVDKNAKRIEPDLSKIKQSPKTLDPRVKAITFTMSLIALAAKLAHIDGAINNKETTSFWDIFPLKNANVSEVNMLFKEAATDTTPPEVHAKRIARLYNNNPRLLDDVMKSLLKYAASDALPNPKEMKYLTDIGALLHISDHRLKQMLREIFIPQQNDPYQLLGISKKSSDSDLKKMYRFMVRDCHPDKLAGGDVAKEIIPIASERFNLLTEAYEKIQKRRKFFWNKVS